MDVPGLVAIEAVEEEPVRPRNTQNLNCRAVAVTGVDEVLRFWWIGGQPLCSAALLFTNDFELGERIQIAGAADGSLGRDQLAERQRHTPDRQQSMHLISPKMLSCSPGCSGRS